MAAEIARPVVSPAMKPGLLYFDLGMFAIGEG